MFSSIRTANPVLFVALIFALVGCPFVSLGLYEASQTWQVQHTFVATPGVVVGNSYRSSNDDASGAYYPEVEFKPEDGPPVRFTDSLGTQPPDYEVGDQVEVLYNPHNAADARINSWLRLWFMATLFTGLGSIFVIIALALMGVPWWQNKRR
jgi:hypothetical protein